MRVFRFGELEVGDKFILAQGTNDSLDPVLFKKTAKNRAKNCKTGTDVSQLSRDLSCIKIIA